jgi:hypothetical protein
VKFNQSPVKGRHKGEAHGKRRANNEVAGSCHVLDRCRYVGWHSDLLRGDSMTKDEMITVLRSVGSNENTITAMCNAFDMGSDYEREASPNPSRETLIAEVTVLTEMVRVLSEKVAEMEAEHE